MIKYGTSAKVNEAMNSKKKRKLRVVYSGKIEDFDDAISLAFWNELTTEEKFKETTGMIKNAMKIKGWDIEHVSGLLRTTAVIKRA